MNTAQLCIYPVELKRWALFFDRIYTRNDQLYTDIVIRRVEDYHQKFREIEWLQQNGIIEIYDEDHLERYNEEHLHLKSLKQLYDESFDPVPVEDEELHDFSIELRSRQHASRMEAISRQACVPVLPSSRSFLQDERDEDVIHMVLKDIPLPDDTTPWEAILDFRADETLHRKYLALINWTNKVSSGSMTLSDIKDEYEYLYQEYVYYLKLHKLKTSGSTVELFLKTTLEVIEAIVQANLFSAVGKLVAARTAKVKLLESENKLPGKELAYIFEAKQAFGK